MVFRGKRGTKRGQIGGQDIDSPRINRMQSLFALENVNAARRFAPASVSTREPFGKSKAARWFRPDSFTWADRQCSRPAIIR